METRINIRKSPPNWKPTGKKRNFKGTAWICKNLPLAESPNDLPAYWKVPQCKNTNNSNSAMENKTKLTKNHHIITLPKLWVHWKSFIWGIIAIIFLIRVDLSKSFVVLQWIFAEKHWASTLNSTLTSYPLLTRKATVKVLFCYSPQWMIFLYFSINFTAVGIFEIVGSQEPSGIRLSSTLLIWNPPQTIQI